MKIRTSLHFAHSKPGGFGRRKKRGNYMEYVIKGREPADALRYFEEICAIPHGSKTRKHWLSTSRNLPRTEAFGSRWTICTT